MRAKLIKESINFQRGLDPKAAMGIGIASQIIDYIKDHFPGILNDPKAYHYRMLTREEYKKIKETVCLSISVKQYRQILKQLDLGIPISRDQLIGSISHTSGTVTRKVLNGPDDYEQVAGPWIILSYNKRAYYRGECVGGEWHAKNLRTGDIKDDWYIGADNINTKDYRKPTEEEKIKYNLE